jgi:hypothetical protein
MSGTPFRPFKHASPKTAPAYLQRYTRLLAKQADMSTLAKKRHMILSLHGFFIFFLTYAMDKVADPFPAFASTTSVPPSCVLLVRALISSLDNALVEGVAC